MKRAILFLLPVITGVSSCSSKAQPADRKEVISQFVTAVENYDTLRLLQIIDTANYFESHSKEHLFEELRYLSSRFKECSRLVADSNIKIEVLNIPVTDYTYLFCRNQIGQIIDGSFDIRFTFADFKTDNTIFSFFVNRHVLKKNTIKGIDNK